MLNEVRQMMIEDIKFFMKGNNTSIDDFFSIVVKVFPYEGLNKSALELVENLEKKGIIKVEGNKVFLIEDQ